MPSVGIPEQLLCAGTGVELDGWLRGLCVNWLLTWLVFRNKNFLDTMGWERREGPALPARMENFPEKLIPNMSLDEVKG